MSKYEKIQNYNSDLTNPLVDGETLIWSAKPKKSAFIINKIITMMPIALTWLALDSIFIIPAFSSENKMILRFIIPFFALHLFPVWIWLSNIITANRKWKNTKYYVTDKRIILQDGLFATNYQTLYYKDIKNVNLKVGIVDKILSVGDIYFDLGTSMTSNGSKVIIQALFDIENPYEIYSKLQKIVLDIQTDIEYPNALRPDENPGYNTKYKG